MKKLSILVLLFTVGSVYADVCGPEQKERAQASAILEQMVQPESMIGSCATTQAKELTNWRDGLEVQVSEFMKQNHEDELAEAFDRNLMSNSGVVLEQTDGYKRASQEYRSLIDSYPDKKGMSSAQYSDVRRILEAKDIRGKDRAKVQSHLESLIDTMSKEQERWPDFHLEQMSNRFNDSALKTKIIRHASRKFCVSGVDFQVFPASGMTIELLKNHDRQAKAALQKVTERIQQEEARDDRVWFCSKPIMMNSPLQEVSGVLSFDVPKDNFFADNQATLDPEKIKALKEKLKAHLSTPPGCVRKVKSVQIETSSNAKANAESIGRWNFPKLSADRAKYLRTQLASLFEEEKKNANFAKLANYDEIVRMNSSGTNGDGTSGPCPYKIEVVNGIRKVLKDDSVWNSKVMEESKYARINFEIQDEGVGCNHGPDYSRSQAQTYAASQCFTVQISCR